MPFFLLLAACAGVALVQGVPADDVLGWSLVQLALAVVGLVVLRAVLDRPRPLGHDLALGLGVGTALLLPAWAAFLHLGVPPATSLATVALGCLAPRGVRHRVLRRDRSRPDVVDGALVALLLVVLGWTVGDFTSRTVAWQTTARPYYPDVLFNLSLTAEAHRALPLTLPQVAGEPLPYHWFANVAMAAAAHLGRVPDGTVVLQLWYPWVTGATALALAAAGRDLLGSRPAGAWAAWLTFGWTALAGASRATDSPMTVVQNAWASPSQSYSLLLAQPLLVLVVAGLRWQAPVRRTVALVLVVAAALSVTKSTALPVLGAGLAVLCLAQARSHEGRRAALTTACWGALLGVVLLLARQLVYGNSVDGLTVGPLSYVWRTMIGRDPLIAHQLPHQLSDAVATPQGVPVLAVQVMAWMVSTLLVVVPGVRARAGGDRVLPPLLLGAGGAGVLATAVLSHPGTSEVFFLRSAFPYLALATAGAVAPAFQAATDTERRRWFVAVGAGAVAWVPLVRTRVLERPFDGVTEVWLRLLSDHAHLLVALVVAGIVALVARRRPGPLAPLAAWGVVLASGLGSVTTYVLPPPGSTVAQEVQQRGRPTATADRLAASAWVRARVPADGVLVTNVHCLTPVPRPWRPGAHCDARGFWPTALAGRRTVVSGWLYARRAVADQGRGAGLPAFWDRTLLEANDRLVERADPVAAAGMCARGARWVVADRTAGSVSPRLHEVGAVRWTSPSVDVVELSCGWPG